MEEKKIEKPGEKKEEGLQCANLPGDPIKVNYRWKDGKRGSTLEKVGETDLQKEANEAARGMTAGEQIARILRGDYSGIRPGDGVTGDITGFSDKTSGEVLHDAIKPMQDATKIAMQNNLSLTELEEKLTEIQNEINAAKKAEEAKKEEPKKEQENA